MKREKERKRDEMSALKKQTIYKKEKEKRKKKRKKTFSVVQPDAPKQPFLQLLDVCGSGCCDCTASVSKTKCTFKKKTSQRIETRVLVCVSVYERRRRRILATGADWERS